MTLVSLIFAGTQAGVSRAATVGTTQGEVAAAEDLPVQARQADWKKSWSFRGSIAAAPLVAEDRVYVALADQGAWRQGIVSCLDASTGKELWNTAKTLPKMKMISISSPCLSGSNLYVGEGYHEISFVIFTVSMPRDGALKWKFQTKSHVESSPVVVDGKVYFGAGDDGIHCLDAQTGEPVWHYPGLHIDSSPLVHKGRVYAGSGVGDEVKQPALICLDASKGSRIWQLDLKQPAWGRQCWQVTWSISGSERAVLAKPSLTLLKGGCWRSTFKPERKNGDSRRTNLSSVGLRSTVVLSISVVVMTWFTVSTAPWGNGSGNDRWGGRCRQGWPWLAARTPENRPAFTRWLRLACSIVSTLYLVKSIGRKIWERIMSPC